MSKLRFSLLFVLCAGCSGSVDGPLAADFVVRDGFFYDWESDDGQNAALSVHLFDFEDACPTWTAFDRGIAEGQTGQDFLTAWNVLPDDFWHVWMALGIESPYQPIDGAAFLGVPYDASEIGFMEAGGLGWQAMYRPNLADLETGDWQSTPFYTDGGVLTVTAYEPRQRLAATYEGFASDENGAPMGTMRVHFDVRFCEMYDARY